jgi:hypothetical protein
VSGTPDPVETKWIDALREAHRVVPVSARNNQDDGTSRCLWTDAPAIPVTDLGPTQPFARTVRSRRSTRRLEPPSLNDLGLIAARAALTRFGAVTELGNPIASRPAPSAGARQPFQLAIITRHPLDGSRCDRAWVLDPDAAALRPARTTAEALDAALSSFADALNATEPPPAAIVAVGLPDRTLARYPDGISLLWREAGALLMLIHLAATDLGLGSCLIGSCGVLYPIENVHHPVDLGAVAIGHPSSTNS